jgi:hypothetical protein
MELLDEIIDMLGTPKKKDEQLGTENLFIMNKIPEEGIKSLEGTRIRIMICLSFINLN